MTKMNGQAFISVVKNGRFCYSEETLFTVRKTSVFFAGDGFNAYDAKGELVFRVDSYGGPNARDAHGDMVLMDAEGKSLLTLRRKRPSLHDRWEGFEGERKEGEKPAFSVRRSSIMGNTSVTVEVFESGKTVSEFQTEGSFPQRSCTVYDSSSKETVAEVRRKKVSDVVVLGKDVFCLCVKPGFDCAFGMAMVLVLDQMYDGDFTLTAISHEDPPISPLSPTRLQRNNDVCACVHSSESGPA